MPVAAQINTQAEFDRTFRTGVREKEYHGRKVMFITCFNIDISPREGQLFPLTKRAMGGLPAGWAGRFPHP